MRLAALSLLSFAAGCQAPAHYRAVQAGQAPDYLAIAIVAVILGGAGLIGSVAVAFLFAAGKLLIDKWRSR